MSRRRLLVVSSSDEEEEQQPPPPPQHIEENIEDVFIDHIETDFQTVTLNSPNPTPNTHNYATSDITFRTGRRAPPEPVPIDIPDEEDEEDIIINNQFSDNSNFGNANISSSYFEVSGSPVNEILERLGLRLRREWLESCLRELQSSMPGFQGMDDSAKAKFCFQQFLSSGMNYCGAGVLPPNVHSLHLVDLKGPFVLQVDEIVNISCALRGRYQNAAAGAKRCLKLSMTDGVQRVFGMEYRPIKDLEVLAPAGLKVAICNVNIRRGLLMLVPEVIQVLGGVVKELEDARQRLVNEVNKPPRGKRNRTGVVSPLASRATLAAWPQHSDAPQNASQVTRVNTSLPASNQGTTVTTPSNDMREQSYASISTNNAGPSMSAAPQFQEHDEGTSFGHSNATSAEDMEVSMSRSNTEPRTSSVGQQSEPVSIPTHADEPMTTVFTSAMVTGQVTTPIFSDNSTNGEDVTILDGRENAVLNTSTMDRDVEEISIVDKLEQHFVLSRDNEIPFMYLASLSAKFMAAENGTTVIRGKIKCFMTAVKGFQYKQRTTYELRGYVDDGSLISEILIDHNVSKSPLIRSSFELLRMFQWFLLQVVQKGIGYSPQEVTNALSSSDQNRVGDMKERMKQFQMFLINFEGIMVVEMRKGSPVPVAMEMTQGCPESDARLLLKRLKSYRKPQPSTSNCIDLLPP